MEILRLKAVMLEKGISRDELANRTGVSVTTISNICSEKNLPTIHLLVDLAKHLDVDIRELFLPTKEAMVSGTEIEEAIKLIEQGVLKLSGRRGLAN